MPDPRHLTANMQTVSALADAALLAPNGIEVTFTVEKHGSLEQCAHMARSLQQSFSSFVSRTRRLGGSSEGGGSFLPRDSFKTGPYDKLTCHRNKLADDRGWTLTICPVALFLSHLDITDLESGEPLAGIGSKRSELQSLIQKMANDLHGFTYADAERALELDPLFFAVGDDSGRPPTEPAPIPAWIKRPIAPVSTDLADFDLSDFGRE